jgi:hypothetical protein
LCPAMINMHIHMHTVPAKIIAQHEKLDAVFSKVTTTLLKVVFDDHRNKRVR